MRKETKNWIDSSDYDFKTAGHMFETGRYLYVIFMCHISIEKLMKSLVHEITGKLPPKTHDLIYLLKIADTDMPQTMRDFVGKLNAASVVTRYPEDLARIVAAYPEAVAREYLNNTKEILQWLKQRKSLLE
jgi:HEPN domain-containing protein